MRQSRVTYVRICTGYGVKEVQVIAYNSQGRACDAVWYCIVTLKPSMCTQHEAHRKAYTDCDSPCLRVLSRLSMLVICLALASPICVTGCAEPALKRMRRMAAQTPMLSSWSPPRHRWRRPGCTAVADWRMREPLANARAFGECESLWRM